MVTIGNDFLEVSIKSKGAELINIYHKIKNQEYVWQGDPAFWGKHSPVLFPIVGSLKDNHFEYGGQLFPLSRHGFARDMEFELVNKEAETVTFLLSNKAETENVYPFLFRFYIIYQLQGASLSVTYKVENPGTGDLWFSVGGHPAFRIPLFEGSSYDEYFLEFSEKEPLQRWPISKDGLIETAPEPVTSGNTLQLTKSLFYRDALVFKNLESQRVDLKHINGNTVLQFNFSGFPYLGIWAAKDADFVCIEPWCGIADSVNSNQQLEQKEGINRLGAGEVFERTWSVTF